jgi:predicted PurR-regulated permease PerM
MTRSRQIWIWIAVLVIAIGVLWLINDILLPFLAAIAIAYFLDPVANRLERMGTSRLLATAIIVIAFFVVVVGLLLVIAPLLERQVAEFIRKLPQLIEVAGDWITPIKARIEELVPGANLDNLQESPGSVAGAAAAALGRVAQGIWKGGLALFNALSLLIVTPVVSFYLLRDWNRVVVKVDNWLPRAFAPAIRTLLHEIDVTISAFVRGQGTVMLVLAAFYAVALTAVGVDFGVLIGLVAGLISFIPYIGAIVGLAVSLAVAIVHYHDILHPALVVGVFIVGHMIEGYWLLPKLVGEKVGLHPVWTIFAIMVGGLLMGFTGVLLAVPLAATIGVLVRFFLAKYLLSPLYSGIGGDDSIT